MLKFNLLYYTQFLLNCELSTDVDLPKNMFLPLLITFTTAFAVLFKDSLLSSGVAVGGDFLNYQLPVLNFFKDSLSKGEFPLWNPHVAGGAPALLFSPIFYPPNWLLFFLETKVFLITFYFAHLLLAFLSMFYLLQILHRSFWGSVFGGLVFVLSGFFTLRIYLGHTDLFAAACYVPLLFYLLERYFLGLGVKNLVLLSLPLSLQILTGHPQISYYSLMFLGVYFLIDWVLRQKGNILSLGAYLFSLILGLGLSSITLLPSLATSGLSTRSFGSSFEEVSSFSLPIRNMKVNFFPWPFTEIQYFEGINFISFFVFLLSLIGFGYFAMRRKQMLFFPFMVLVVIIFSAGSTTALFEFLYKYLPGFSFMRAHIRSMVFLSFAIGVGATYGWDLVTNKIASFSSYAKYSKSLLLLSSVLGVVLLSLNLVLKYLLTSWSAHLLYDKYHLEVYAPIAGLILLAFALFLSGRINLRRLQISFITLIMSGSYLFSWDYLKTQDYHLPNEFDKRLISLIKNNETKDLSRVWVEGEIPEKVLHRPLSLGLYDSQNLGWNSVITNYLKFKENKEITRDNFNKIKREFEFDKDRLSLFNVRYFVTSKEIFDTDFQKLGDIDLSENNKIFVYHLRNPVPRFFFKDSSESRLELRSFRNNKIELRTEVDKENSLIFSQIYDPNWKVLINNTPGKVSEVFNGLVKVNLAAGTNNLTFYYDQKAFVAGAAISVFSLLTLVVLFLILNRKEPSQEVSGVSRR